jgi:hypothetical protein
MSYTDKQHLLSLGQIDPELKEVSGWSAVDDTG